MRPQLTFRQYRAMDLTMLSLILIFCEWLIVRASTRWFPNELYVLSVTPVVTAIVMIRWGVWGFVPALAGGAAFCMVTMWIARRLDGVLEDQKHYLHRVGRGTEDGGTDL